MAALLAELGESELRRALAVVLDLADDSADRSSFIEGALERLTSLVPSDLTTLSLCDLERGTRTVFGRPGEALSEDDRNAFNRHFHQHPLVRFHGSHPRGPTQRISDCPSPAISAIRLSMPTTTAASASGTSWRCRSGSTSTT